MDLAEYLDFFAEYLDVVFMMCGKIEKSHGGTPPGPRGGAEAGVRREAPNGGRSGAPRARRCAHTRFSMLPTHREKNVQLLSTEVRATQQNPRYSAKNNVAMRMIATFMPKIIFICMLVLFITILITQPSCRR